MHLSRARIVTAASRRHSAARVLRSLSTTVPTSAQLLNEYIPPKSNNMVGATRAKIARIKKHESMPIYDKQIFDDVERVYELEKMPAHEKEERVKVAARVSDILKEELGEEFDVVDISPYTWGAEMTGVEIELAIVAKGVLDPLTNAQHFKASNSFALVELLAAHGISAQSTANKDDDPLSYPIVYSRAGHVYIHPAPHEAHVQLRDLLKRYMETSTYSVWMLALFRAWINSFCQEEDARRFSTTALALIIIAYLQRRNILPNYQAEGPQRPTVDKFRLDELPDMTAMERRAVEQRQFKHTIGDFFGTMSSVLEYRRDMISVKEGGWVARSLSLGVARIIAPSAPLRHRLSRKDEDLDILDALRQEEQAQYFIRPGFASIGPIPRIQPEEWMAAPLVVQHPFMPQVNMTRRITRAQFHMLRTLMQRTAGQLKSTTPLPVVFGPEVPPASGLSLSQLYMKAVPPAERHPRLEDDIVQFYERQKPRPETYRKRETAIEDLKAILADMPSGYQYHIGRFGSTVYCDSNSSDLDLVILDDSHPAGFPPSLSVSEMRRTDIYNMKWLATQLRKSGKFDKIVAIPSASVPIVKAVHKPTGVRLDVNTNERLGIRNAQLLKRYCDFYPYLPHLIFTIKRWANVYGMNNSSTKGNGPVGFSSYCLTLMLIFYLQTRAVLPSLQDEIKEANKEWFETTKWVRLSDDQRLACDTRFGDAEDWEITDQEVGDLLAGFFRYWSTVHNYGNNIASIKDGRPVPRRVPIGQAALDKATLMAEYQEKLPERADRDNCDSSVAEDEDLQNDASLLHGSYTAEEFVQPESWTTRALVVQDPFFLIKNVASNVDKGILERFRGTCLRSLAILDSGESLSGIFPPDYDLATARRVVKTEPLYFRPKPSYQRPSPSPHRGGEGAQSRSNQKDSTPS